MTNADIVTIAVVVVADLLLPYTHSYPQGLLWLMSTLFAAVLLTLLPPRQRDDVGYSFSEVVIMLVRGQPLNQKPWVQRA